MISDSALHLVKAVHNFKGSNNDELCFKKGDIITVTQCLEGGWWEGTLNGITGWFPSNYIKEIKPETLKSGKGGTKQIEVPLSPKLENMKMYRGIVFKDIVDTENNHLTEIQNLVKNYVHPLGETDILSEKEFKTLAGNIEEICNCNSSLLIALEELKEKPSKDQKIGGVFIRFAPQIKDVNTSYCSNHPKAAVVIEEHKDAINKFMEEHGASPPGILTLTTGLSRPFRRLEKYPALLQELQRHTEEYHVDRGDTQRAISVYKDIASACQKIRRQKEMELEVMSGNIQGWEGEDIRALGDILHMGLVVFLTEDQERKDRYLVAFPQNLVILSVSPRMNAFVYEGKLPMSGISINKLDPTEGRQHSFEITGNMIQRIIVICPSQEVLDQWLTVLHHKLHHGQVVSAAVASRNSSQNSPSHHPQTHTSLSQNHIAPQVQPPPHLTLNSASSPDEKLLLQNRKLVSFSSSNKIWTSWSLRPHPPVRPSLNQRRGEIMLRRSSSHRKEKVSVPEEKDFEGDMKILQVIEAYCTSAKTRYTVNSVDIRHLMALQGVRRGFADPDYDDYTHIYSRSATWCCGNFSMKTVRKYL